MMAVIMFFFGLRLVQVQALQANDYRSRAVNEMKRLRLFKPHAVTSPISMACHLLAALRQQALL